MLGLPDGSSTCLFDLDGRVRGSVAERNGLLATRVVADLAELLQHA